MKPLYNFMDHLPSLDGEPAPILPRKHLARTTGHYSSIDLGRGCPYQCSFCTIINVQGRKSRFRTPDDLEQIIRENRKQGIDRFFITDDNFARNSDWEILLDRVIKLKDEGIHCGFTIQVDTLCHKIPNFIEKATKAGARRIFIGLENINPDNLIAAKKRQNKITEYRIMLQKWRAHGALTFAGYILGFPADTKESILRDVEIIKRELPLDILEFFFLTPLPGSEDHKTSVEERGLDGPRHQQIRPRPSRRASLEDVGRRVGGGLPRRLGDLLHARAHPHDPEARRPDPEWPAEADHEHDHVVQAHDRAGGRASARRRRLPAQIPPRPPARARRANRPSSSIRATGAGSRSRRGSTRGSSSARGASSTKFLNAPDRWTYTDLAIAPPKADEFEQLSLYHATTGGEAALARKKLGDSIRESARAPTAAIAAEPAE